MGAGTKGISLKLTSAVETNDHVTFTAPSPDNEFLRITIRDGSRRTFVDLDRNTVLRHLLAFLKEIPG